MTTSTLHPPAQFENAINPRAQHEKNARVYLLSLRDGIKPGTRLDFGYLENVVREAEHGFDELKPEQRKEIMPKIIDGLGKWKKFQRIDVEGLLAGQTAEQGSTPVQDQREAIMPPLPESARLDPRLTINVCPEFEWFCRYAERIAYRSYSGFYLTAAIHLFSAIAAGRPVLQIGGNTFHTGLYFAHIADTTMDAKSFLQRNVVERCAEGLGLSFLFGGGGRNTSPEKFLANLAGNRVPDGWEDFSRDEQVWKEAVLAFCAQRALYFDEGGEFVEAILQKNSTLAKYADLLLQLYSAPPVFDGSDTLSRGAERVHNACITIMMSMTIPDIAKYAYAGSKLWAKGFWGRFDFMIADEVTEEEIHQRMAKAKNARGYSAPPEMLIASLHAWHKRLGVPFCEVVEAKEEKTGKDKTDKVRYRIDREPFPQVSYEIDENAEDAWLAYTEALQVLCLKLPKDLWGNYGRLPETAMRMALIIASLSNTGENRIELKHWAKAQEIAEVLRENLHKLYAKVATPEESFSKKSQNKILEYLEKNADRWIDSSELQRYCHLSGPEATPILAELVRNEMVQFNDKGGDSGKKKLYRSKTGGSAK